MSSLWWDFGAASTPATRRCRSGSGSPTPPSPTRPARPRRPSPSTPPARCCRQTQTGCSRPQPTCSGRSRTTSSTSPTPARCDTPWPPIVPLPVHCLVLVLSLPFHCPQVDADDVVLGFLKPPGAGVGGTPLQTLFGFERVHVKVRVHDPGGVTVSDSIALTHPDRPARRWRSTSEPP